MAKRKAQHDGDDPTYEPMQHKRSKKKDREHQSRRESGVSHREKSVGRREQSMSCEQIVRVKQETPSECLFRMKDIPPISAAETTTTTPAGSPHPPKSRFVAVAVAIPTPPSSAKSPAPAFQASASSSPHSEEPVTNNDTPFMHVPLYKPKVSKYSRLRTLYVGPERSPFIIHAHLLPHSALIHGPDGPGLPSATPQILAHIDSALFEIYVAWGYSRVLWAPSSDEPNAGHDINADLTQWVKAYFFAREVQDKVFANKVLDRLIANLLRRQKRSDNDGESEVLAEIPRQLIHRIYRETHLGCGLRRFVRDWVLGSRLMEASLKELAPRLPKGLFEDLAAEMTDRSVRGEELFARVTADDLKAYHEEV